MIQNGRRTGPVGFLQARAHPGLIGGGHIPGVLGIGPGIVVAQSVVGAVTTKLPMPRPFGSLDQNAVDFDNKDAHVVTGDLFAKGGPALKDVKQGIIPNCSLASMLAAHAHTETGRRHLLGMVKEHSGTGTVVETDVSPGGPLSNPPKGNLITSSRFFAVTVGGKTVEVSDVFWTNDGDRNSWSLLYMKSPTDVLWPIVIEKTVAVLQGGYHKLGQDVLSANAMWKVITGKEPKVIGITPTTPDATVLSALRAATTKPTIAASRDTTKKVFGDHGLVVLGVSGSKILLHDPALLRKHELTLKQFRDDFEAILGDK